LSRIEAAGFLPRLFPFPVNIQGLLGSSVMILVNLGVCFGNPVTLLTPIFYDPF
jgi:hypothetical protein